jgi:Domain of unknown function (DUF4189)
MAPVRPMAAWRVAAIAMISLLGFAWSPIPASGEGALAVAFPTAAAHFSVGFSANWGDAGIAHREALRRCQSHADSDEVKSRCVVITDIHRECVAFAGSAAAYGWGIDRDLEVARKQALDMCQSMDVFHAQECQVSMEKRFNACDQSDR